MYFAASSKSFIPKSIVPEPGLQYQKKGRCSAIAVVGSPPLNPINGYAIFFFDETCVCYFYN